MLNDELIKHITTIHTIELVPVRNRTEEQDRDYIEAKDALSDKWLDCFKELSNNIFIKIMFFEFDEKRIASLLMDDRCSPPTIKKSKQASDIENMIEHIYGAQTTIGPVLEEVISINNYIQGLLARAKNLLKVIYPGTDAEWKINSLFEALIPEKVADRAHLVGYYASALKVRDDQLEKARRDISRLLTSYTESLKNQIEPMSRVAPDVFNSSKSFRNP